MRDHFDVLREIGARPGMWLTEPTFASAVTFITGYELGCGDGVLTGFREWLIVKVDGPNNATWPVLVKKTVVQDEAALHAPMGRQLDGRAFAAIFQLLEEFRGERNRAGGLRRIFLQYESWLRKQSWYTSGSPDWVDVQHGPKLPKP